MAVGDWSGLSPGALAAGLALLGLGVAVGRAWGRRSHPTAPAPAVDDASDVQALTQRLALHQAALAALDEGVVVFGTDRRVLFTNAPARRLFGDDLQHLHRRDVAARWQPCDESGQPMDVENLPLVRVLRTGEALRGKVLGMRRPSDGRALWFIGQAEPVRINGVLRAVVITFHDISERRATQQALDKLSLAAQQLPVSLVIVNNETRLIEYVNAAWTSITGYTAEESIGQRRLVLQPGPEPEQRRTEMLACVRAGGTWRGEMRLPRKSGELYTELVHAAPIRASDGPLTHYVMIGQDVTDSRLNEVELEAHRHHLQELVQERTRELRSLNLALADRERFIRTIADNQPGLLSYWDAELRCRFANRAYRDWFGRSEDELIGAPMGEVLGAQRVQDMAELLAGVRRGQVQRFPLASRDRLGRTVHRQVEYVPDMMGGVFRGFLVVSMDVTEVRQAEQQLQQANAELVLARDRAEAANRAKTAFLANMSHEIRTPMNAIQGWTYLLRREATTSQAIERLDKIADATGLLLQLIEDILDLSAIETGRLRLQPGPLDLRALLRRSLALVAERAAVKRLSLGLQIDDEVPDAFNGDAKRLTQMLLNLLGNAVKFTDSGRIDLQVDRLVELDPQPGTLLLRFTVRDTGIGIDDEQLRQLYHVFSQGDASTTRRHGGTGLGLSLTQRLAGLMDGEVGVRSRVGQGSEFWFTARLSPRTEAAPPPVPRDDGLAAAAEALRARHAGRAVLLAEDNPVNQEVALELLQAVGLVVDVADDGAQALSRLEAQPYALALVDMQMPHVDGLEVARRVRSGHVQPRLPLLAMTANAYDSDRRACEAAGMNGHVPKPVDPQHLYGELLRLLDAEPRLPADAPSVPAQPPAPPAPEPYDVQRLLKDLQGQHEALERVLRQFRMHFEHRQGELLALLQARHNSELLAQAHALKGAALAIGAQTLAERADQIKRCADAGGTPAELTRAVEVVEAELTRLLKALARRPHQPPSGAAGPRAAFPVTREELELLAQKLEVADFAALRAFSALEPALAGLPADCQPAAQALTVALNAFDFEAALVALRELQPRLPRSGAGPSGAMPLSSA